MVIHSGNCHRPSSSDDGILRQLVMELDASPSVWQHGPVRRRRKLRRADQEILIKISTIRAMKVTCRAMQVDYLRYGVFLDLHVPIT